MANQRTPNERNLTQEIFLLGLGPELLLDPQNFIEIFFDHVPFFLSSSSSRVTDNQKNVGQSGTADFE